jgi:DNA repair protein RadD
MQLRYYQQDAINACYKHLADQDNNPCIVVPTGGGKTPILTTMCVDVCKAGGRVLVVTHVKELIEQTARHLNDMEHSIKFGVYSASLKSRNTEEPVIVAGIQSIYKNAQKMGVFDLIVIDEAHLIPPDGEGMYQSFLTETKLMNPKVRIVGLTATPYRMKGGWICKPENILNEICYEIGVKELINAGFLSPLISKAGIQKADLSNVHIVAGDYNSGELEKAMNNEKLIEAAVQEIICLAAERYSVLIFSAGVEHGRQIQKMLTKYHEKCEFVCGDSLPGYRRDVVGRFKSKETKFLCNAKLFTTGFDAPNVDCVVLLTSTLSTGLYYQMVGRGLRIAEGKKDCLILDYGNNIVTHGCIDALYIPDKPKRKPSEDKAETLGGKECPKCQEVVSNKCMVCIRCGYEFPLRHEDKASEADILSKAIEVVYDVEQVMYCVHTKRNAKEGDPRTMRVDYIVGWGQTVSEWVCVEHSGFARQKAEIWWAARTDVEMPDDAERAVELANNNYLLSPKSITVVEAPNTFTSIIKYDMDDTPCKTINAAFDGNNNDDSWVDDIPF